ncbi:hypothetical protein MGYG_07911 [Nannizzia gypsea CBS 118893]|uniref:Uncharacterized protein n=1 Tax=Arthroderma gypseum (strain ATCC MYA-4604 / CBS 118893) TaxID=535722 RepID=E4V4I5_ARTGP|nr:hypothetical protein MGYG_07911 [Nannizzia gypsea CBS 118893]EFR04909.1 hypothetical protein MGYG_07911 [Nannizzia gypsea CBS 118893]
MLMEKIEVGGDNLNNSPGQHPYGVTAQFKVADNSPDGVIPTSTLDKTLQTKMRVVIENQSNCTSRDVPGFGSGISLGIRTGARSNGYGGMEAGSIRWLGRLQHRQCRRSLVSIS